MDNQNQAPVRLSLLGALRIETPLGPVQRFQTQKTAALLAFLALQPTRAHGREFLIELFWPESEREKGQRSLRVALTSLRRQLEPPGVPTSMVLIADRNLVRLNFPVGVQTDVADFEAVATAAGSEDTLPEVKESLLDEAIALYGGPLLPGFYDDWAIRERERLVDLYRGLLLRRARLAEQKEGFTTALDYARRAVNLEEDREAAGNEIVCEDAHIAVIRLLTRTGRHDEAHRQYDTLARRLSEFYDEAPSPRARALLVSTQATVDKAFPPQPPPKIPAKTATISVSSPLRLPLTLSRFFGRGPEMDQVNHALFVSDRRLVTLTGPGGSGKTRFAIEFARQYSVAANTTAVFFATLADADSAAQIWTAIADALGIDRQRETKSLRLQIIQTLLERSEPDGDCLLILDNFEMLVDTGAPLAAGLMEEVPHLRLLVTSRRRLGIPGEQEIPITPLPVPTLPGTPERLLEWSSVQLFVDRAQTARPDFQITPRNSESIATLCSRLDGIPLALELTAAWAGVLSPAQMLDRVKSQLLDEEGPPLAYHRARRAERHRTLRAAIDSSFTLLSPELKDAFIRLSVFRGGWALAAAEHLLSGMPSPAADILSRLRERSLIVVETARDSESVRFRMLDSLREFAAEMFDADQTDCLRKRCAVYFTNYEAAASRSEGNNPVATLSRIDADYPNYAAAVEWFAGESPFSEDSLIYGMRLSGLLSGYWLLRGYTTIGCDFYRRLLDADLPNSLRDKNKAVYVDARLTALLGAAALAMRSDSNDEAAQWSEEALALTLQGYGSDPQRVEAYNVSGMCAMAHGDYPLARTYYETALDYQKEKGLSRTAAAPLTNLGLVCWYQGDFLSAERYFTASLQEDRETRDRQGEARSLLNLGLVACVRGELDRSRSLLEESLFIRREMKDQHGLANVLGNLGEILLKQNKEVEAKEALSESLSIARMVKDSQQIAYALGILGLIATRQQQYPTASQLLAECVSLLVGLGDRFHIQNALEAYAGLAYAAATQRAVEKATSAFERAARFWAAADRLREEIGNFLLEEDKAVRDAQIAAARAALGPRAFDAQQAAGKTQTLNDLVTETQRPL